MNKKKLITFVIIFLLIIIIGAWYFNSSLHLFAGDSSNVSITTGGTRGTYFVIGGAIADAVNKAGKLKVTSEKGYGAVANTELVANKDIEFGITQADIAYWAYNGQFIFKDAPIRNIRAVCALYPEHIQLLVAKGANINKIEDLRGKRVGVGLRGSGTEGDVKVLLKQAGLSMENIKTGFLDFSTIVSLFKHNRLDAGFIVAGVPTRAITELFVASDKQSEASSVTLLNFDEEFLSELQKNYPFIIPSVIPAETYKGLPETRIPSVMSLLVVNEDANDKMVYNFLKGMYDNLEIVQKAHECGKYITLERAIHGLTIPLHPAAEKFFREKGIIN